MVVDYKISQAQKKRIFILKLFFIFFFLVIISRLFYIQIIKHKYYTEAASKQQYAFDTIPAKRGQIFVSDNGTGNLYPLAENQFQDMVFAVPKEIKDRETAIKILSEILKKEEKEVEELLNTSEIYAVLGRKLTQEQSTAIKESGLKGVYLKTEEWRYYPEGDLASHILGYVNDEGEGQYGVEGYLNDSLSGVPGLYKAESDIYGRKIAFGTDVSKEAVDGKSVVLTINRDIQYEAQKILKKSITKFKAEGGSLIVMDPKTGKILAMANAPDFDPNKYKENKDYNLFKNKAVTDSYEPGSIMKVITMAAGLDEEKVEPDTKYTDTGTLILDGNKIMNSDKKAHGEQTMTQVLEQSLNTGVVFVMEKIGVNSFFKYFKNFGFGERTGIAFSEEASGSVLWDTKKEHTIATMTFGQSISTTPIQMINSFSAIANGGVLMRPQIIEKYIDKNGKEEPVQPEEIRRVISEKAAASLTSMLVSVVEKGHGYQAKIKGYKVAGKTGTAQVPLKNGLGYDPSRNIGSFIGFAPAMDPEFIVMAKIDSPKGVQWAESTATPVVGEMLDILLKYYQVPPTEPIKN